MRHIRCTALTWVLVTAFFALVSPGALFAQGTTTPSDTTIPSATDGEGTETTDITTTDVTAEDPVTVGPGGRVNIRPLVGGSDVRQVLSILSAEGRALGRKPLVPSQNVKGTISLLLEDVSWDVALEAVLRTQNLVQIEEENLIYIYTAEEADKFRPIVSRIFKLSYLTAEDAKLLVEKALSPKGSITTTPAPVPGIAPDSESAGGKGHASGEVLIVYDYKENLEAIEDLLSELDTRPQSILIEATILSATLTEENALGVNIDAITGAEFGQFVDADGLGTTTDLSGGLTVPATNINNLNRRQARFSMPMTANQALEGSPLTVGLVWNDISVFVRALEQITDTTVLANPKLLVVNSMRGEVLIGRKEGYLTTTITTTAAAQTVEYLETGTRLIVRPWVVGENQVRMEIHPEVSEGGVEAVGDAGTALPSAATTETTTNVMVEDGKTLVIAGLFRERDVANRAQVPVLGSIPLLGLPFRSTADTKLKEEVIILITPHIIRSPADEAVSEQLRNDIERVRIGARRGMMWLNRGQFADWHYQQALRDLSAGKGSAAMWNLDLALAYEPKMMQAIRKKEELTDRAYWADQPRFVASRNIIRRMIMQELGEPVDPVIYPDRPLDSQRIPARARDIMGMEDAPTQSSGYGPARMQRPVIAPPPAPGPEPEIIAPPAEDYEGSSYDSTSGQTTLSEEIIIEADDTIEAPTPPGHSGGTAPVSDDDLDEGATQATPTIDRLLDMQAPVSDVDEEDAASTTPTPAEPKATTPIDAPSIEAETAEPASPPVQPRRTRPEPNPGVARQAPVEVTQRPQADQQSVQTLRVWVPKRTSQQQPEAHRNIPSLWEAMNDQEAK